jgi:N-acetylmuramic acid 6-phosphate (MurNAc-6-P) etherase
VKFSLALREQGTPRERAIDMVSEKFDVDRRTFQRELKEGEEAVKLLITMKALAAKADNGAPRYVVSDAALTAHFLSRS